MSTKPLVLWAARRKWSVRYTHREAGEVRGLFTTPDGPSEFRYESGPRRVHLPDGVIHLNEYGWEVDEAGRTVFRSVSPAKAKESPHE